MKDEDKAEIIQKPCPFEGSDACDRCDQHPCPNAPPIDND